jgi:hypothetical protein
VQVHDDREAIQTAPDDLPVIDIRSLCTPPHRSAHGRLRTRPAQSVKNRSLTGGVGSVATADRGPPEPGLTRTPPHRWVVIRHRLVKVPFTVFSLSTAQREDEYRIRSAHSLSTVHYPPTTIHYS